VNVSTLTIEVEKIGTIEMIGRGPWKTVSSGTTREIHDADDRPANPTVTQRFSYDGAKPNRGVIFSRGEDAQRVVDAANAKLAPAAPTEKTPVDG
jgi:hypothetical protein